MTGVSSPRTWGGKLKNSSNAAFKPSSSYFPTLPEWAHGGALGAFFQDPFTPLMPMWVRSRFGFTWSCKHAECSLVWIKLPKARDAVYPWNFQITGLLTCACNSTELRENCSVPGSSGFGRNPWGWSHAKHFRVNFPFAPLKDLLPSKCTLKHTPGAEV